MAHGSDKVGPHLTQAICQLQFVTAKVEQKPSTNFKHNPSTHGVKQTFNLISATPSNCRSKTKLLLNNDSLVQISCKDYLWLLEFAVGQNLINDMT